MIDFKAQFIESDLTSYLQQYNFPVGVGIKLDGEGWIIEKRGDAIVVRNFGKRVWNQTEFERRHHSYFIKQLLAALPFDGIYLGEGIVGDGSHQDGKQASARFNSVIADGHNERNLGPLRVMIHSIVEFDSSNLESITQFKRREILEKAVIPNDRVELETWRLCNSESEIQLYFEDISAKGFEGLVIKPNLPYQVCSWLKLKRLYPCDVAVLGAKKTPGLEKNGITQSFLIGVWEPTTKTWIRLGSAGTGISKEDKIALWKELMKHRIGEDDSFIYVEPTIVFEIGYQELNFDKVSGKYSMRFKHIVRIRQDKLPIQCLINQLQNQNQILNSNLSKFNGHELSHVEQEVL